ncbi:lysine-specific demethylase 3B-like [Oppia nitens]|uniref:lysine-specific demethylase 3B-like n=1 Tax=Oppia nitens TaxID=1686743 RepID=UPI0023DBD021|nr:lysine-specific demethylase 3B-like [Oppia nitens]
MAHKYREREEIVGKRFIYLQTSGSHKVSKRTKLSPLSAINAINNHHLNQSSDIICKRGTVRAASHHDPHHHDLTILVEFDGQDWNKREWIRVYDGNSFQLFLIEKTLVWYDNKQQTSLSPSLNFKPLVDKIGFEENKLKPIELLIDKQLEFVDCKDLTIYQDEKDLENQKADIEAPEVKKALRKWTEFQDSQKILLTTPSVLVGYRVKVYRSEGTTQWYTAVIVSYNDNTRELTLTDDTVLEEHNEDPSLVQMKLIGDGVVESILKGEDIGITPRRRTCNQNQALSLLKCRVITSENKSSVNVKNVSESHKRHITKENKDIKDSIDSSDQQVLQNKPKKSNNQKTKSDIKKIETINSVKPRNSCRQTSKSCEIKAQKAKELLDTSDSSDTEIEDSLKISDEHKKTLRNKGNRKKCQQISESDLNINFFEEDSEPQVISSDNSIANTNSDNCNDLNVLKDVKDLQTICCEVSKNEKLKESCNKRNELKSRTDQKANDITSVKCVSQLSQNSINVLINTTKDSSNSVSVIRKDISQSNQTPISETPNCDVSPTVPIMCSISEPLNTLATNQMKCETFPKRSNIISEDNRSNDNKTDFQHLTTSGANSVCVNLDIKCNNNNNLDKSLNETNNSKASLALNRHESVTVYRDPNLVDKQIIRHIDSVQHIRHGLMHSVNTTSSTTLTRSPDLGHMSSTTSQVRSSHPSILPPSMSSMSSIPTQYKLKTQPTIHSQSPSQSSHILPVSSSHPSHRLTSPVDPIYHHLMQTTHPMVPGLNAQAISDNLYWQQKNYQHLSSIPGAWNLYNEQIRAQVLQDKHQRIDRERRDEKEKLLKNEKESKDYNERIRHEVHSKNREENAKEAVDQHFEESLRLMRQKNPGWSPNLQLSKTPTNLSHQSHGLPQHQLPHSASHVSQHSSQKSREYVRERDVFSKEHRNDSETWLTYMQPSNHQHSSHTAQGSRVEAISKQHLSSARQLQSQPTHHLMSELARKGATSSPVMDISKHNQMSFRAKNEPSLDIYGYKPNNQNIGYITAATAAQLKDNNRLNISSAVSTAPLMTARTDHSKVGTPSAHSLDKRESPKIDRSITPNSRNSTPLGRPPSLSPKQKSPKLMTQERVSPLYHRSQNQIIKQYDYPMTSAPPAHQGSTSRSTTPHLSSASPISFQIQSQIPTAHSSQNQEQPQNLVKTDSKSKSFNDIMKTQIDRKRCSPNMNLHQKSPNLSTNYQSFNLIQQGLVPNPSYKGMPTTQLTNTTPSVITRPHSAKPIPSTTPTSSQSQSSAMFNKPGPGIMSGIPVCRPNSIPYYEPNRTNVSNSQKYPQSLSLNKTDSNIHSEANRSAKPTHQPYIQTQDRNVFHRVSSPHSPRISSGPIPQSPYGPPPGMVSVGSNIPTQVTPPAAHSGINPYNMSNVKRKSLEPIVNPLNNNKKPKHEENSDIIHTLQIPSNDNVVNTTGIIQSTSSDQFEPLSEVPIQKSNAIIDSNDTTSEKIVADIKPQISSNTSNETIISSPTNSNSSTSQTKDDIKVMASTSSATITPSTTSSFHPKLKKAWLQRHSEDKTGVSTTTTTTTTNVVIHNDISNSNSDNTNDSKVSDVTINGVINKKEVKDEDISGDDDDTTSTSETELSNSSKSSKRTSNTRSIKTRKRVHNQNKDKDLKKRKSESNKSDEKIGKENEEKKKKDKNKNNDKESNDLRSTTTTRRGRKPKALKNDEKDKSSKEASGSLMKKKGKSDRMAIAELKKTGKHFLQGGSCVEVAPKLPKCRECRMTPTQRNRKPTIFCRFYDYRKLVFKSNILTIAGFSQPQDASEEDLKLWLPNDEMPADLDLETAKFVIAHVGDQFCDLVKQEKEAQLLHMGSTNKNITWKRVVQGVREMCDVCETTLFNIHWVCDKCGFVVCIDCYKARKVGSIKEDMCPAKDRDGFQWLLCNNRQQHEPQRLEVTQIIAASALSSVGRMLHNLRTKWNISANCTCVSALKDNNHKKPNGFTKQVLSVVKLDNKQVNGINDTNSKNWKSINGSVAMIKQETDSTLTGYSSESGNSPLSFFVDVALTSEKLISKDDNEIKCKKKLAIKAEKESEINSDGDDDTKHSTLRELLMGPTSKLTTKDNKSNGSSLNESQNIKKTELESSDVETKDENCAKKEPQKELQHFTRRYFPLRKETDPLPIICRIIEETKKQYPQIPHDWFSDGKLLVLLEPKNPENIALFQEQWIRGQPVLVKNNHKNLNSQLWHPDSFSKDFGDIKNDLINCLNGDILQKQPMRKFWDGFENLQIRMKDKSGEYMLLKLKDWPPDEEFSELLPTRYKDLMSSLPLPEYTSRNGVLNLAGRLPDCFVRPDLGPKMYSAYGSCQYSDKGTTNLHLDISDAVNVMIFVGIPKESYKTEKDYLQEVQEAVDSAGCDEHMKKRVREKGVKLGALWHIYSARDADKIRDLLNKVAIERGETLEPHHDPIHDQSWYLDENLRNRLSKEYGVEGYAIAQCLGDAIFIPAGAPHQVRNLNSCIKVAGDFVSPENVSHCFNLTQEFRQLSDTHTNHEDKLQIKNIIYHAVKDALSVLRNHQCPPNDSQ